MIRNVGSCLAFDALVLIVVKSLAAQKFGSAALGCLSLSADLL
jgi:hypothetical protein